MVWHGNLTPLVSVEPAFVYGNNVTFGVRLTLVERIRRVTELEVHLVDPPRSFVFPEFFDK